MDLFRYIVRFLYKIRWYLIILPLIALIVAWFMTRNMERVYDANTTIYTGSGKQHQFDVTDDNRRHHS